MYRLYVNDFKNIRTRINFTNRPCIVHNTLPFNPLSPGMNTVVGSHDIHVGKLLGREDETRAAEFRAMAEIVDSRRSEER